MLWQKKWNKGDMLDMTNSSKNSTKTTTKNLQPLACENTGQKSETCAPDWVHPSFIVHQASFTLFFFFIIITVSFFHSFIHYCILPCIQSVCVSVCSLFLSFIDYFNHSCIQSVCVSYLSYLFHFFIYIFIHLLVRALIC